MKQLTTLRIVRSLNTTRYGYDAVANQTRETDPMERVTKYAYDGLNRQVSKTDAAQYLTQMRYDSRDLCGALNDIWRTDR